MMYVNGRPSGGPLSSIGCLIIGGLLLVGMFYFLNALYKLLWWAAAPLFVLSLIINWRVVTGSLRRYWLVLQRNPLVGLLGILMGVVMFPFLCLSWFLMALGSKRLEQWQRDFTAQWGTPYQENSTDNPFEATPPPKPPRMNQDDYADYEEIK
jgi:D-alanyl-lipoteichoic acid acyltransferase DltB (MBOAT superfamily)